MTQLIEIAKKRFAESKRQQEPFTKIVAVDVFLNNIEEYPHAYVLGCLMDRQMKSERSWQIPYEICARLGTRKITELANVKKQDYTRLFRKNKLHRFNDTMATVFYDAILRIKEIYNYDASKIWSGRPSSASVVYRFMEFNGGGIKIATMAANLLVRCFKIPFSDYYSIDISPDVHVRRVLLRMGHVHEDCMDNNAIIYKARELNPEFPGIIDPVCFEIGRNYCRPANPKCDQCPVRNECQTHLNK